MNAALECTQTPCADLVRAQEQIKGLANWQKAQNGAIQDLRADVRRIVWFLLATFATSAGTLVMLVITLLSKGKL